MAGSALDQATMDMLEKRIEMEMLTQRSDGSPVSRPIWVVTMHGNAYVRSYLGPRAAWYRRALAAGGATIGLDDRTIDVGVQPVSDKDLNRQVSEAYRAKYGARSPEPTESMVAPEASGTTLRLTRPTSP